MRSKGQVALCILAVVVAAAGCLKSPLLAGETVLHVYTWSDYFDPDVVYEFEAANKCRVAIDYFDSNESMYAKLKAGGGGYDIITPSSYMSAIMRKQDMLRPLDHALLPNLQYMDRNFTRLTEDAEKAYGVPYTRTVTGVGYNAKRVDGADLGSWDIFSAAAYTRRMTMLNDMRESIGAALKYLGYSLNTTDESELAEAGEVLKGWKKQLAKFDVDEAKIGLASGEFTVIHGYNGDVALIMEENPDIEFFIPREGTSISSDDFVIPVDASSAELAHAFINHLLDPETAAANMESIRYYMPNPSAVEMLSEELRENHAFSLDADVEELCEVIRDLGSANEKYIRIWDLVKASD